jgi:SAM-dependent methyltransferase
MKNLEKIYSSPLSSDYSEKSSKFRFQKIFDHIENANDLRILDYGCGPGNLVEWMNYNSIHPKEYFGYDIREETIAYAKKRFPNFYFGNQLPSQNFDIAIFCGTISYAYDDIHLCKTQYAKEIRKALKLLIPSGIIYGTARKLEHLLSKDGHTMITYSKEELFELGSCEIYDLSEKEWLFKIKSSY